MSSGLKKISTPVDPRTPGSNYLPFDVKIGPAKDYPDTKVGRSKMFEKLKEIRKTYNPNKGYGLGKEV
jgi:hypothetical protein